jgi:hypothetical protein
MISARDQVRPVRKPRMPYDDWRELATNNSEEAPTAKDADATVYPDGGGASEKVSVLRPIGQPIVSAIAS